MQAGKISSPEIDSEQYDYFWKNGYLIFRSLFSEEEIEQIREYSVSLPSESPDLLSDSKLRKLVTDDRLTGIAGGLLKSTPVYFSDSGVQRSGPVGNWHKDNAGRYDPAKPDWSSSYPMLRFGLYLQDHAKYSGGLSIRRHSHLTADPKVGKGVYFDTQPGDLAVWHFRITHRGNASLLRGLRTPITNYRLDKLTPQWLKVPHDKARYAIFIAYGAEGQDLDRYIEYLSRREYAVKRAGIGEYDEEWLKTIDAEKLVIRDARQQIRSLPADQVKKKHFDY